MKDNTIFTGEVKWRKSSGIYDSVWFHLKI